MDDWDLKDLSDDDGDDGVKEEEPALADQQPSALNAAPEDSDSDDYQDAIDDFEPLAPVGTGADAADEEMAEDSSA